MKTLNKTPARRICLARIADRKMAENLVNDLRAFNGLRCDLVVNGANWHEVYGPADKADHAGVLAAYVEAWTKGFHRGYGTVAGHAMQGHSLARHIAEQLDKKKLLAPEVDDVETIAKVLYEEGLEHLVPREDPKAERFAQRATARGKGGNAANRSEFQQVRDRIQNGHRKKRKG